LEAWQRFRPVNDSDENIDPNEDPTIAEERRQARKLLSNNQPKNSNKDGGV
jgi:hypothetical protein